MQKSLTVVLGLVAIGVTSSQTAFASNILYSTLPGALPPDLQSLGYETLQTAEYGGLVQPAFTGVLDSATIAMSSTALEPNTEPPGTTTGFNYPLTLNIYGVGAGDSLGPLLGSVTTNPFIPWTPPASLDSLFLVSFDFTPLAINLPSQFIFGLAFNTQDYGANPTGVNGPYNGLGFGVVTDPPSVGTQPLPNTAFWNTPNAAGYTDGGLGGVGIFRLDTNWAYSAAVEFDGSAFEAPVPEPSTCAFIGLGLLGLGFLRRQRKA